MANNAKTPAVVAESPITAQTWWDVTEADEVEGQDLLKDEALFQLVGVPFMAFRIQYREGVQRKDVPYRDDYASIELRIAPESAWNIDRVMSRRNAAAKTLKMDALPYPMATPDEQLVINDGSTGIYRQITQYLAAKELIVLPEGEEEGDKGHCIFDLPRSQWVSGADEASKGFEISLRCTRGLRFSDYANEYTGTETARTWYIA